MLYCDFYSQATHAHSECNGVAGSPFEYGTDGGVCTPYDDFVQYSHLTPEFPRFYPENAALAAKWCDEHPQCLGIHQHYTYDRYYIAVASGDALLCPDYPNCGDGTATNTCRVKFRCGETVPYQYTSDVNDAIVEAAWFAKA
jgi:hypothetical protein